MANTKSATTQKTNLHAKDVMTAEPVCVEPSTTIRQLAALFDRHEISGAPVVDQGGRVIGVVSKTDLLRRCSEGSANQPPGHMFEVLCDSSDEDDGELVSEPFVCVGDFMTESPVTVSRETPVSEVARRMYEARVHRVIVIDKHAAPIGIITSLDVLRAFA